jgi:hypothetical protein
MKPAPAKIISPQKSQPWQAQFRLKAVFSFPRGLHRLAKKKGREHDQHKNRQDISITTHPLPHPLAESKTLLSGKTRMRTTVLETETASPEQALPANPSRIHRCHGGKKGYRRAEYHGPGTAIALTAIRSLKRKCSPIPNISKITPTSESCLPDLYPLKHPGYMAHGRCPPAGIPQSAKGQSAWQRIQGKGGGKP